jgi:glycosyltransferase involved in cell wall biosynthesis
MNLGGEQDIGCNNFYAGVELIVTDSRDANAKPLISIITATYNAGKHLPKLIESIKAQTDRDFEWVVADGASTDDTLDLLRQVEGVSMVVDSRPDCGIYDAFNRGIGIAKGKYYLVAGADDMLYPNAVGSYKASVVKNNYPDLVIGSVMLGRKPRHAFWSPQNGWLGAHSVVSSHSVGMLIKKGLHDMCGYYSLGYIQAGDAEFIKRILGYPLVVGLCDVLVGEFFLGGISNQNVLRGLCENFLIQFKTESNKMVQIILFNIRLIKNFSSL